MAFVWQWVLTPQFSGHRWIPVGLGFPPAGCLNDPGPRRPSSIGFINLWQLVGYYMVLFLAGLSTIPPALDRGRGA